MLRGKRTAVAWAVLEILRRGALRQEGWRYQGVRGWMLYEEVDAKAAERVSEVLPRLAQLRLAHRVDVHAPARRRPLWMYRISAAGLRALADHEGTVPPVLSTPREDPADRGTVFIVRRSWPALEALQGRTVREGWASLRELAAAGSRVDSEDMGWLVRNGLVERRRRLAGVEGGTWEFRASAAVVRTEQTHLPSPYWVRAWLREPQAETVAQGARRESRRVLRPGP